MSIFSKLTNTKILKAVKQHKTKQQVAFSGATFRLVIVIQQNQWKAENKEVMFTCVERILYTTPPANQRPVSQLTNQPTKQKSNQTKKTF